jgi:hypothetical protein
MRPNGVWAVVAAAVTLSLIPLAAAQGAVAPPKCWKGKAGCTHTSTPHWNVQTFGGTVTVVGTRQPVVTCADTASGPREEIVAGRYTVKFTLDRKASQTRIGADAHKNPTTSNPLKLAFDVASTTHEQVRTLTPTGDGQTCTESFRDCDKTAASRHTDTLDVFARANRIVQETPGDFIKPAFLECAETPTMASLLPGDPLEGTFMSEQSLPSAFRHRDTVVTQGRDHQIGDGNTSVDLTGKVTYGRSIRACTRYPLAKPRCRTARG